MTPEIKTAMFALGMAMATAGLTLSIGDIVAGIIRRRKDNEEKKKP